MQTREIVHLGLNTKDHEIPLHFSLTACVPRAWFSLSGLDISTQLLAVKIYDHFNKRELICEKHASQYDRLMTGYVQPERKVGSLLTSLVVLGVYIRSCLGLVASSESVEFLLM